MKLVIYDTSNYVDYPIGGQLTSVRNFLRYVAEEHPEAAPHITLLGITTNPRAVGMRSLVSVSGVDFPMLPVCAAEPDLADVHRSLRMCYAKGLIHYLPKLGFSRDTINFIHTPEAFGPARIFGRGRYVVMSHGSFLHMTSSLRFYKKGLINWSFQRYLIWVIKNADLLLTLDDKTLSDYANLGARAVLVSNSIDYQENVRRCPNPEALRLLFVGRLSAVKNIGPIIEAAESMSEVSSLVIVGEGEEHDKLLAIAGKKAHFTGGLGAIGVREQMRKADVLIMNSIHEGVPMAILEGMGMALPVVTTDVGGVSRVVRFGENAEKTDGTSESIATAIRIIVRQYERYSAASLSMSSIFGYRNVNKEIYKLVLNL